MPRKKTARPSRSAAPRRTRRAAPAASKSVTAPGRPAILTRVLEAFTSTLDLDEVLRRVVSITREEFGADRVWLMHPIDLNGEFSKLAFEAARPGFETVAEARFSIPIAPFREMIRKTMASRSPVVMQFENRRGNSAEHAEFNIKSVLFQLLEPANSVRWGFVLHQCTKQRHWSTAEIQLFQEIGRYATLAIHNAEAHRRAVVEAAKVAAMLDQLPEAAAIFDAEGKLLRINEAALRERTFLLDLPAEERLRRGRPRYMDGRPLTLQELPFMRALRGETVKAEYIFADPRTQDDHIVQVRASPIEDEQGTVVGSVVLASDVTEERQKTEADSWRRRRTEALASLGLMTASGELTDLNATAATLAGAVGGNAQIFFARPQSEELELAGASFSNQAAGEEFRRHLHEVPYRAGEGVTGTVFTLGKPLMFSEMSSASGMRRDERDAQLAAALGEESLIAYPIEAYGQRLGVVVLSHGDPRRRFGAEELAFAQAAADRIGSAWHTIQLTRFAQEGHRAAEELARREVDARARLEGMLETAPIGIAVISADELRFEMANPLWVDFASRYGKVDREDSIAGLRVSEVIPFLERQLQSVAERGEVRIDDEVEVRQRDGHSYFKRIISPVRGRLSGTTQSLTVLVQEVTDQVRTLREVEALLQLLEERTARLDSILGSMTDALWVYDSAGNVVDVNPAALAILGLASRGDAVLHGSLRQLQLRFPDGRQVPPEEMPQARALRGEVVPDYLAVARHLITGRDVDLSIAAAPIESGGVLVGAVLVMRDISALQELDRKKDEFLSVASHELRTPLTTVKGYSQLLAQSVNELDSEERLTYLRAILGEVDRMMGLITELLDVSRIETNRLMLDLQTVQWTELIERQAEPFRVQNPKRKINLHATSENITLEVDPLRMRQVIDNLLSNAIKYSPDVSEIEIRVSIARGIVRTAVTDHGIGIPRDEIPQLFERFHRARNVSSRYYGGLGLGLYIARAIVEAHGGTLSVVSEEGKGSTFTVALPLHVERDSPGVQRADRVTTGS